MPTANSRDSAAEALLTATASALAARRMELQAAADAAGLSPDDIGDLLNSRGGVIVFADDGYLSSLEIFWLEKPISPLPPLDQLRLRSSATS